MTQNTKRSLIGMAIMSVALIAIWQGSVEKSLSLVGVGYMVLFFIYRG